jgi:23S rRNA pseudouridine2604 synthase
MCELLGYHVINLIRVRVMNIELGKLKENTYREIAGAELREFLKELGLN